jgi:hypothetical protein
MEEGERLMATTVELLRAARAKIERPGCWTKGAEARSVMRRPVKPTSPSAVSWCPIGALRLVAGDNQDGFDECLDLIYTANGISHVIRANDEKKTTHGAVVLWFDKAIAAAESK